MKARVLKKQLKYMVPEIRLVVVREPGKPIAVNVPRDMDQFVAPLRLYAEENFVCFYLNSHNEVTGYNIISRGTVSASLVHPREVFKGAIITNASGIIVAHNHPGGSTNPSKEDLDTTVTLVQAGEIVGIGVVDHLIVTANEVVSIREKCPELWDMKELKKWLL